jgi:hypothetical protein
VVGILLEQRFEHGAGLLAVAAEDVALLDLVGPLAAGERRRRVSTRCTTCSAGVNSGGPRPFGLMEQGATRAVLPSQPLSFAEDACSMDRISITVRLASRRSWPSLRQEPAWN